VKVGDLVLSAGGYIGIVIGPGSSIGMGTMLVYYAGYGKALSFVSQIKLLRESDKKKKII
jgi:hypothetical protein